MKRPQLVMSKDSMVQMLQAANAAWDRRDFQQCFELMERASRLAPSNPRILLLLGQRYGLRYDYDAAAHCFDKAVRVVERKSEALAAVCQLSAGFANPKLPEQYFQMALKQKDAPPETFARAAEFYEGLRRTEEASQLLDRALQLNPAHPLALLTRARLLRHAKHLEEAERVLQPVLTTLQRPVRIRGYYELGAILDRQGRYDEAMTAFMDAKAMLAPEAPPFIAKIKIVQAYVDEMLANISSDMLRRWYDFNTALQPAHRLAFLCGHPRSGTTLLEQVLDSHPEIVSAEETGIFEADAYGLLGRNLPHNTPMLTILEEAKTETLRQARKSYFRTVGLHLGQPVETRLLIDKNPSFNALIPAFVRIFPETKFLIAVRDPRDVCLSFFMQEFVPLNRGGIPGLSLQTTVEIYARLMGIWKTLQPLIQNSWLEVRYEDIIDDLESAARRTLEFLGVSWDPSVLRFDEHVRGKRVRSPTYADVAQPVYKRAMGRWRNYQKYLEPHLAKLEPYVKAFGYE